MDCKELSNTFVKDPHTVVKAGDVVKVRVKEVDVPRKRIALSMKTAQAEGTVGGAHGKPQGTQAPSAQKGVGQTKGGGTTYRPPQETQGESALAAALKKAMR